jgi:predicted MFS family arabinose efflux permease
MLTDTPATRLATRLSFFAAGFGASCWAPLVPFVKSRLAIDEGTLGLLLLCLGIGSVLIMPATGGLVGRFGSRTVILSGGLGFTLALPLLAVGTTVPLVASALLLFGASLGAMDVAMKVHAVEVERGSTEPLMSGFHGLFSFGGVVGAGSITLLLASGASLVASTVVGVGVVLAALAIAAPRYLETRIGRSAPFLVRPRGLVLLLGALAFIAFLVEGAVLDWSALLMTGHLHVPTAQAGVAYAVFSVAMTVGRLTGDRIVATLGGQRVLVLGGLLTAAGLVAVLLAAGPMVALGGFLLVGLGASNIVPVLFTQAGRQTAMPSGLAIASMTAIGYAGILAGPAAMGFVAQAWSLPAAFATLAALMLVVPLCARPATR